MLKWTMRFGYLLLVAGAALLSPLADLLPVNIRPFLSGDLSQFGAVQSYRVVPTSGTAVYVVPLCFIVGGIVLVALVWLVRRRRPR
jgi:hypothetical protein